MPTPHIEAKVGEIAPIVITAGDPKRCQYIANKYLKNANACLSEEAKEIINWLKVNNKTYISELSTDDDENAIVGFYNKGKREIEKEESRKTKRCRRRCDKW